jgi:hypothetical protein
MQGEGKGFREQLVGELHNSEEFPAGAGGVAGSGNALVEANGFLQTIEVRRAVGTPFKVPPDFATLAGIDVGIELVTHVPDNL